MNDSILTCAFMGTMRMHNKRPDNFKSTVLCLWS